MLYGKRHNVEERLALKQRMQRIIQDLKESYLEVEERLALKQRMQLHRAVTDNAGNRVEERLALKQRMQLLITESTTTSTPKLKSDLR